SEGQRYCWAPRCCVRKSSVPVLRPGPIRPAGTGASSAGLSGAASIRIEQRAPWASGDVASIADRPNPPAMRLSSHAEWCAHRDRSAIAARFGTIANKREAAAFPLFSRALAELPLDEAECGPARD